MALSEQEQRMLAEIEQALIAEDPRLAKRASSAEPGGFHVNIRSVALIMLGLVGLVGGIALAQSSLWFVALSVAGFLVMFAGGLLAFRSRSEGDMLANGGATQGSRRSKSASGGPVLGQGARGSRGEGSFGDKMEDKFRRRFEN